MFWMTLESVSFRIVQSLSICFYFLRHLEHQSELGFERKAACNFPKKTREIRSQFSIFLIWKGMNYPGGIALHLTFQTDIINVSLPDLLSTVPNCVSLIQLSMLITNDKIFTGSTYAM